MYLKSPISIGNNLHWPTGKILIISSIDKSLRYSIIYFGKSFLIKKSIKSALIFFEAFTMSKPEGNIVLTHTDLLFIVVYGPIIIRGLLLAKDSPIASFISKFFTKFFLPSITNEPLGRNCPVGAPFFTLGR